MQLTTLRNFVVLTDGDVLHSTHDNLDDFEKPARSGGTYTVKGARTVCDEANQAAERMKLKVRYHVTSKNKYLFSSESETDASANDGPPADVNVA